MSIQLQTILDAPYGPLLTTQLRWQLAKYEQKAHAQHWPDAASALENICAKLASSDAPTSPKSWQALLTALTHATLRAELTNEFTHALNTYSPRAFPENTPPHALAPAFADLNAPHIYPIAAQFGEIIAGHFPTSPLGFYLAADFSERTISKIRIRPTVEINQIIQNYQAAIRLSSSPDLKHLARFNRTCQLRLGAFLLTTDTDRDAGRQILKTISPDTLSPSEALWYARAMLHSTFWLDRVRSADILANLDFDPKAVQQTARALLHASPFALQPAEQDRLTTLANALFTGPEAAEWHQLLELRPELQNLQNLPLDHADDAFTLLNQLARTHANTWQDTFHSFARLQSAFIPNTNPTHNYSLQRPNDTHRYRFSELTGDLLDALSSNNLPKVNELLRILNTTLRRFDDAHDTMELKPVALLWPRLLPRAHELSPDADLQQTALAWLTRAPSPSYGFWLLAAHFLRADLFLAARAATTRALSDATPAPHELRRHVLGHLSDHANRTRDPDAMLTWLTHFKNLDSP